MIRRTLIGTTLAALCAAALAATALAGAGRTAESIYRPFSTSGSVLMTVTATRSGSCWTSSETTPRRDAWRCLVSNLIYDPCFNSTAKPGIVLCPTAPWTNAGTEIRLTEALPLSQANHGSVSLSEPPWAIQLTDGRDCLFDGGATAAIGTRRLNYFCSGLGYLGLWGYPDRRVQPWTIYAAPESAKHLRTALSIRHAWM